MICGGVSEAGRWDRGCTVHKHIFRSVRAKTCLAWTDTACEDSTVKKSLFLDSLLVQIIVNGQ